MDTRQKKAVRKTVTLLLCLVLAAAFLLCGMTCAKYVMHCCDSNACRICDLLFIADQVVKQLVLAVLPAVALIAACDLLYCVIYGVSTRLATLVRLKIRLNY